MIKDGVKDRGAIHAAVARGMKELTGATDEVEAWRSFFEPGDVVGVKMNPVGRPLASSSNELMLEVIDGLQAAGVKAKDIVVFERYRDEFLEAKMHEALPDGIAWTGLGIAYNGKQVDIKGDDEKSGNLDQTTGYDPDEFMVMELVMPGLDPKDDRTRRSHLGLLVTRRVNKIVLPAGPQGPRLGRRHRRAQEHEPRAWSTTSAARTARRTRTSATSSSRRSSPTRSSAASASSRSWTGSRASTRAAPARRGPNGPGRTTRCYFATDPVAMDHVAWRYVDAKRKEKGLPPVGASGKLAPRPA